MPLILILLLAVFQCSITNYLIMNPDYYQLGPYTWESGEFRSMKLGTMLAEKKAIDYDMLTTLMIEHDYDLTGVEDSSYSNTLLMAARPADYRKLRQAYETVMGDLKYFPVPLSSDKGTPDVVYENGWLEGRSYRTDGENAQGILSGCQYERRDCGADWMAGDGGMAHRDPKPGRGISLLCPSVRLCQGF